MPVGVLSELAEELIAVHGQNDQLRLLHPTEQRAVLDTLAGDTVAKALAEYRSTRAEWIAVAEVPRERTERARDLAQQAEMPPSPQRSPVFCRDAHRPGTRRCVDDRDAHSMPAGRITRCCWV